MRPPVSPSILPPPPGSAPGVQRLNRLPYFIIGGAVVMFLGGVGYTMVRRHQASVAETTVVEEAKKPVSGKLPRNLRWPVGHGEMQAELTAKDNPNPEPAGATKGAQPPAERNREPVSVPPPSLEEKARMRAWEVYYQQREAMQQARFQQQMTAHTQQPSSPEQSDPPAGARPIVANGGPNELNGYSVGGTDPAGQTGKQAFLRTQGDVMGLEEDLPGSVHGPKHSTLMEGSIIPARMVDGIISDLPNQINAEVYTNVYDSETGDILLIPQWSKLVGYYDIAVSNGQERVGVIWQRIVFPDTSSRQLGTMPGADQAGYAGFKDLVDTHFWEKFQSALMVSIVGAGAQLAQPPQSSVFAPPTAGSQATGAFTQQLSQFGIAQAQRGLSIPNTLQIRPGYIFNVKINKDMTLPAYVDQRQGGSVVTAKYRGNAR